MILQTKYAVGDEVWFMHDNKPIKVKVSECSIGVQDNYKTTVKYRIHIESKVGLDRISLWLFGSELFPTKQALLDSL